MDPFADIFPDILENSVQEAGDLIGETLALQAEKDQVGEAAEVFSPPKKSFGLAAFDLKGGGGQPVQMVFGMELAIELAGRLVMLPADEIAAAKKQGQFEGELEDAFSEIANIISGVLNSVLHQVFPKKKLHFVKGDIQVFPGKTKTLPLPEETLSAFSGDVALNDKRLGMIQFFLPHSLVAEAGAQAEEEAAAEAPADTGAAEKAAAPESSEPPKASGEAEAEAEVETVEVEPEPIETEAAASPEDAPPAETPEKALISQEVIDEILTDGLEPAQEELGALLGDSVAFTEPQTGYKSKQELLAKTKGKQVLTRIEAAGMGEGYMLLPLKDALYFGGVLLMLPADSIAQTVKYGKFEGEVADAFGEIANILVGCYNQRFHEAKGINLSLKRGAVESLVAAQADLDGETPFPAGDYYLLSARIQMGEKNYGPLELFFPSTLLGLAAPAGASQATAAGAAKTKAASQKAGVGQKSDTGSAGQQQAPQNRVISIIGDDPGQAELVAESIAEAGGQASRLSFDEDFKQSLSRDNPSCVFLLINQVNDQGLAKAIKVRSAMEKDCPLIVAGPEWTRSLVVKARKYGADDIVMTPADREIIQKKYRKYM